MPLPKKLGGDPITTSGLIYNQSGEAFYLEDNSGDRPWPVMQRELNAALDAVAKQAACKDALEVDVVALGDDTDADSPAIYGECSPTRCLIHSAVVGAMRWRTAMSYRNLGAD